MPIVFTALSPHPPIILPSVGSKEEKLQVEKTIESLYSLREKLVEAGPQEILIASPHPDWGFNVPLFFLAKDFKGEIKTYLIGLEEPEFYFNEGKRVYGELDKNKKYALIASGDLSHCLKEGGPYGFQPDGPKLDKELLENLKKKDTESILKLDKKYPEAGECGSRPLCFILGILEASGTDWQPEILSYEGPFGVGYAVANFNLK